LVYCVNALFLFITIGIKLIFSFFYSLELAENDDQFSFKIIFHGPNNRSYILGADSQESMEQWMKSLACASYDYMKFMVADLQRQLKELEGILILIFTIIRTNASDSANTLYCVHRDM